MNLEKIYQQTILEYSNRKDLKREIEKKQYICPEYYNGD